MIVILVLTWNAWHHTRACLQSLSGVDAHVIMVDNGSTDGSLTFVRREFPHVEVVENGCNLGFAEGNNRGIAHALSRGAEYIMLLNNDTVVDPGFLEPLVDALRQQPAPAFASPRIYEMADPQRPWFLTGAVDWRHGIPYQRQDAPGHVSGPLATPIATGCCLLADRTTWERVGLLDERYFFLWEDVDWTLRVTRGGGKGFVIAESRIWHAGGGSDPGESPLGAYYYVRNGLLFIRKHSDAPLTTSLRFYAKVNRDWLRTGRQQGGWRATIRGPLAALCGAIAYLCNSFGPAPKIVERVLALTRASH
jgi:GT2 family glycosyltransferase